jgi:hypothetical protein
LRAIWVRVQLRHLARGVEVRQEPPAAIATVFCAFECFPKVLRSWTIAGSDDATRWLAVGCEDHKRSALTSFAFGDGERTYLRAEDAEFVNTVIAESHVERIRIGKRAVDAFDDEPQTTFLRLGLETIYEIADLQVAHAAFASSATRTG